jgi:hypothetical protein
VWNDANQNGRRDDDTPTPELRIPGVLIRLYGADGTTEIATDITDANGDYSFIDLLAGTYILEIDESNFAASGALNAHVITTQNAVGVPETLDSDYAMVTPYRLQVILTPNVDQTDQDAGAYQVDACVPGALDL